MKILSKFLSNKELKYFREILNGLEEKFQNPAFRIVREKMEIWAKRNPKDLKTIMNRDIDHELWLIGHTSNISGDLVESGKYHLYRGVLNPMGPGENFLKLFDQSTELSFQKGEFDRDFANKQKRQVRINMRSAG